MGCLSRVCAGPMWSIAAGLAALIVVQDAGLCDAWSCDSSSDHECLARDNLLIQKAGMHRPQMPDKAGSLDRDFVQTPFSTLEHRSCVVVVPSGTQRVPHPTLHDHHILKFANGTNRTLEPCKFAMPPPYTYHLPPDASKGEQSAFGASCDIGGGQASSGPMASYGSDLSSTLQSFTANVYVPEDPPTAAGNTWLYWWIGSLPKDYSHVLQPVLGYNKAIGWEISSWDCCPGGNKIRSEAVKRLQAHEKIPMRIVADPWVRDQYKVEACSTAQGKCATLTATNTGSQIVPLIQFETYNVAKGCGASSCSRVSCNYLPTSALAIDSIQVSPPTTWKPISTRCWSLANSCGWKIDMYTKEKGYQQEALWASPPR